MQTDRPLKTRVCITLDDDVEKEIRALSEQTFRSFSQYINVVLRKHIVRERMRRRKYEDNL